MEVQYSIFRSICELVLIPLNLWSGKWIPAAVLGLNFKHQNGWTQVHTLATPAFLQFSEEVVFQTNSGRSLWFERPTGSRAISARCWYSIGASQVRASAVNIRYITTSNHQWHEGRQWTVPLGWCKSYNVIIFIFSMIFNVLPSMGACYYNPKRVNLCLALYDLCFQRYLVELVLAQQPLPRRQEAESLQFTSGGITQSALVTHEEVQEWATGSRKAIMCSISHAWETREHPDPCRQGITGLLWIVFSSASLCWEHNNHFPLHGFNECMLIVSLVSLVALFFSLPRFCLEAKCKMCSCILLAYVVCYTFQVGHPYESP